MGQARAYARGSQNMLLVATHHDYFLHFDLYFFKEPASAKQTFSTSKEPSAFKTIPSVLKSGPVHHFWTNRNCNQLPNTEIQKKTGPEPQKTSPNQFEPAVNYSML